MVDITRIKQQRFGFWWQIVTLALHCSSHKSNKYKIINYAYVKVFVPSCLTMQPEYGVFVIHWARYCLTAQKHWLVWYFVTDLAGYLAIKARSAQWLTGWCSPKTWQHHDKRISRNSSCCEMSGLWRMETYVQCSSHITCTRCDNQWITSCIRLQLELARTPLKW